MVTESKIPTPAQVAQNEAARQAVMLVFGLVTAIIVMKIQARMVQKMMPGGAMPGSAAATDAERTQRMQGAKKTEAIWQKVGTWIAGCAMLAYRQADKARDAYNAERP